MPDTGNIAAKQTVLVVDDAPENIAVLSALLKGFCRVRVATNGEKALEIAFSGEPPDLILLDVMMPGLDGHAVCRRLKADARTRDIPVIFLTAKAEVADEQKGFELGAVDYITKPISPPIVIARVQTHLKLRRAAEELRAAYEDLDQEFRSVGEVQTSLLPASLPEIPGFQVSSHCRPARRAGGDAFDLLPLPEGRWAVMVADVSGHGAPSAVMMAMICILVRTAPPGLSPGRMLTHLNATMARHIRSEQFVTAVFGILDPAAGTFHFANAGHPPMLLWRRKTGRTEPAAGDGGMPLGIDAESVYESAPLVMEAGDVLLLYTDGITEAANAAGELFGEARLAATMDASAGRGTEAVRNAVLRAVDEFRGPVELADDVTMLVLQSAINDRR